MGNKKYQVFISSTYSDLVEERRKILDILLMADCIPAGMESFVATDAEQFEVIKKVIDLCDYYVLIIGKRYGSVNPQTGLSYTEMEYDYAKQRGVPVLVFAINEAVELPDEKVEKENSKIEALKQFRLKALTNRLASVWMTPDELTGALAIAIMRAKSEIERPGWQRATDYDEATLRREIMTLQDENKKLSNDLAKANNAIKDFTEEKDVAFDDCVITIKCTKSNRPYADTTKTMKKSLPELFRIVATEMMDVSLTESSIEETLKVNLYGSSYGYSFDDSQLVKRILNQLKALNLIYSKWSKEHSLLYWGLTTKGCKVRDEMILVKNKDDPKQPE